MSLLGRPNAAPRCPRALITCRGVANSSQTHQHLVSFPSSPLRLPFTSLPRSLSWTTGRSNASRAPPVIGSQADTHTRARTHRDREKHTRVHLVIMPQRGSRDATHAGSWYESRPEVLSRQLDGFLEKVPSTIDGKQLPIPKSRVIIAP